MHSDFFTLAGKSYAARLALKDLNVFVDLGNLISRDNGRLLEADAVSWNTLTL